MLSLVLAEEMLPEGIDFFQIVRFHKLLIRWINKFSVLKQYTYIKNEELHIKKVYKFLDNLYKLRDKQKISSLYIERP